MGKHDDTHDWGDSGGFCRRCGIVRRARLRPCAVPDNGCRCETLDASEGGGTDPRACPEHAFAAGMQHMAKLISYRMRTDYPMNRHAIEWADWIEKTMAPETVPIVEAAIDPLCPTSECRGECDPEAHGG